MRITVTFFFSSVFLCLPLSTPTTHNTKHAETQGNGLEHNFVLYSSFFFLRQKKNKKDGSVRRKHTHTKRETSAAVLSSTDVSRGEDIVQKKKKTHRGCAGRFAVLSHRTTPSKSRSLGNVTRITLPFFFLLLLVFFFFFLSTFLSVSLRDLRQQCTTLTETNKSSLFPFDCFFFLYFLLLREREEKKACVLYYCYYHLS